MSNTAQYFLLLLFRSCLTLLSICYCYYLGVVQHCSVFAIVIILQVNGLDEAKVTCYKVPFTTVPEKESELPQTLQLPLHKPAEEVHAELREQGLYYGTTETL